MVEVYDEFVVFDLKDTGERKKLKIRQEDLQTHLNSEQVLIIIREDLRRIYIWKGSKSPVRKRFISSKVAQELQKELTDDPRYHRCKIVSIDQGDELQEFLNAFKLESMEVKERLPDMHYVRNIEKQPLKHVESVGKMGENEIIDDYYSPGLEDMANDLVISSFAAVPPSVKKSIPQQVKQSYIKKPIGLSEEEKESIKKKILELEVPNNYERQNLILGHSLYGAVSKVVEIFGKNVVDTTWEEVKKLPKEVMVLDNNKFRIYFDEKKGLVEAIEVLKKKEIKKQKKVNPNKQNNLEDNPKPVKRELPKIPSNNN